MSRHVLTFSLGVLLLCLAACNLSAVPPTEEEPLPTDSVIIATNTPPPTATTLPTQTPAPTSTTRPIPVTPVYNVNQRLPAPACGLFPNVDAANIRSGPGTNFPVIGVLPANNWIWAARINANGWYQVSLIGSPVEGGWISNTVTVLQQPCVCGPNNCTMVTTPIPTFTPIPATFTPQPPPDVCALTVLTASDSVPTYMQPSTSSQVSQVTITSGMYVTIIGRTNDGWYAFEPGIAQAANVGINRLRWVSSAARITLTGAKCGTLPIINLDVPVTAGLCSATPINTSSIPVYPQTTFSIASLGTLQAGVSALVVGQTPPNHEGAPNGWYAIDPGARPNGSIGKYRLQWIPIDDFVSLNGDCSDINTNLTLAPF
ncbi:MAG: SH3 domain-containing protein [Anaerolineae bacterium]|nr:SH3 domain-containing protein [Anaerolineae bacterium]